MLKSTLLIVFTFAFISITSAQTQKKFYEHRKFLRGINEGTWAGLSGEYAQLNKPNPVLISPGLVLRFNLEGAGRFFIQLDLCPYFKFNGPLNYKGVGETDFTTINFPYRGDNFKGGIGYCIKDFFIGKGAYALLLGADYSIMSVYAINLKDLENIAPASQELIVQKFGGYHDAIKPYLGLEHYFWVKNCQFALQVNYSLPAKEFKEDPILDYQKEYLYHISSGQSLTARLLFNLTPVIRFNPAKMISL